MQYATSRYAMYDVFTFTCVNKLFSENIQSLLLNIEIYRSYIFTIFACSITLTKLHKKKFTKLHKKKKKRHTKTNRFYVLLIFYKNVFIFKLFIHICTTISIIIKPKHYLIPIYIL